MVGMTRSAFPLRFKDPETKAMLRLVSDQLGVPMNDLAEDAIRHELVLLGADIERQLTEIVNSMKSYNPQADLGAYLDAFASGEGQGDPVRTEQVAVPFTRRRKRAGASSPKLEKALAAFEQ